MGVPPPPPESHLRGVRVNCPGCHCQSEIRCYQYRLSTQGLAKSPESPVSCLRPGDSVRQGLSGQVIHGAGQLSEPGYEALVVAYQTQERLHLFLGAGLRPVPYGGYLTDLWPYGSPPYLVPQVRRLLPPKATFGRVGVRPAFRSSPSTALGRWKVAGAPCTPKGRTVY